MRVLVVDDEPSVVESVSRRLGREGFEVETADNTQQAIEKIETSDPAYDVVVTDMFMDVRHGGMKVIRAACERDIFAEPIVLTAYASSFEAEECVKQGAFAYVPKVDSEIDAYELLVQKVKEAVAQRRADIDSIKLLERSTRPWRTAQVI